MPISELRQAGRLILGYFRFRRIRASDVRPMVNSSTVAPASGTGTVSAMIDLNDSTMLNMLFMSVSFAVTLLLDREHLKNLWQARNFGFYDILCRSSAAKWIEPSFDPGCCRYSRRGDERFHAKQSRLRRVLMM